MAHKCTQPQKPEISLGARITIQGFLVTHELLNSKQAAFERKGGGKRSRVKEFSRASRWRLLKTLAVIDWRKTRLITLTYPAWVLRETLEKNQFHLRSFVERWVRHYGYRPSFVWRKEYTKAGIVHFHLLQPRAKWHDDLLVFVSRSWAEILAVERKDEVEKAATKVEFARTSRKAMSYVSKYIAKSSEAFPPYHKGRVWGWVGREGFAKAKKHIYPVRISEFFNEKQKLENKLKHWVYAKRLQKLLKWW